MPHSAHPGRARGFSLVEMLVVIGIIVVVMGILLPAMMDARRSARASLCLNNLRQLGLFYHLYAAQNQDLIPLGTSHMPPTPWPGYHTANNQYLWVEGAPSAAVGSFLLRGFVNAESSKILYCPLEEIKTLRWEFNQPLIAKALIKEPVTIQISYAVRPLRKLWTHDKQSHTVTYPFPMPKLVKQKHYALMAEHPQLQPYAHRSGKNYYINALYADASVRTASFKQFKPIYEEYVKRAEPEQPGFPMASNLQAINEDDKLAPTIWRVIDEN